MVSAGLSIVGRTPPGVRELKLHESLHTAVEVDRRTPPGVRELKLEIVGEEVALIESHPSRGA